MKKHCAAATGNRGPRVVIDLDDEIVEVVVTRQPVAAAVAAKFQWPVVMAAGGVFAPGVVGTNRADGQKCLRPWRAVGAPPQSLRPERPLWGAAVALALVGDDSAAPQGNRDRVQPGHEPAAAGVAGCGMDKYGIEWPAMAFFSISD